MSGTAAAVGSRLPAGDRGLWGWYGASLLLGVVAWPGSRSILAMTLMGGTLFVGVAAAFFSS